MAKQSIAEEFLASCNIGFCEFLPRRSNAHVSLFRLDKAEQDAVLKAAATAEARGWKMWEEKSGWYLEQLKSHGMKVQPPGPKLKEGLAKVGETLTADWLKKAGATGKEIIDAYRK